MKKEMICVGGLILAVSLTGCGNAIPEMSSQQEELVVEYASDVLLRHSKNYGSKLVDLSVVQQAEEQEAEMKQAIEAAAAAEEEAKEQEAEEAESSANNVEIIDNTGGAAEGSSRAEAISIEEVLGLDSVKIAYAGYETTDFYPEQGEELFFVMNATEGNKLLVLRFQTENLSQAELPLDIAQSDTRFRISVNGETKNALTTMLPNDLANYRGTLSGGESVEMVLICEVSAELAEEISTLEMILRGAESSATISLN